MEPAPPPVADRPKYSPPTSGIAVASVSLGYFSMLVFWWKPFGLLLAAVGLLLGLVSLAVGNRGGLRNENLALTGTLICAFSLGVINALYWGVLYVMWGYAPWPQEWGPQYWLDSLR
ncbi:MAG: hypothetical protein K2X82_23475 [Gemmataceae bacterium]|nr:hypothetical protein [Gemmataceae bacterium]